MSPKLALEFTEIQLLISKLAATRRGKRQEANLYRNLVRFFTDRSGATAIEYGLIAAGISVAIIVAVGTLGTNLNTTFSSVSSQLK